MDFIQKFNRPKTYLLLANILLVFLLIVFNNLKILPLKTSDFIFFSILVFAFALYRPGWAFLIFIGMIPLENINLAPEELGIAIRPFQLIGALVIMAVAIKFFRKKLNFQLIKPAWQDWLVFIFTFCGFLSALTSANKEASLKLSLIMLTFVGLYFLVRNFMQDKYDLMRIIPFFMSSSLVVIFYGIWQNIRFLQGGGGFEVMPGRPNATFTEAEWLGMFLVLLIGVIYVLIYKNQQSCVGAIHELPGDRAVLEPPLQRGIIYLLLTVIFTLLIITVSRSAWLGALAVMFMFLFVFLSDLRIKGWKWKETIFLKLKLLSAIVISIAIVYIFHLTNFQLFNRVQSTGTGLQKITVSCQQRKVEGSFLPEVIDNVSELEKYGCVHIDLEDIEKEKSSGRNIFETYRKDPNVQTRSEIYKKSWVEIKNHPIAGIGWGSISEILGKDGRGAGLNSSNMLLEVWLGAGVLGLLSFVMFWFYILIRSIIDYRRNLEFDSKAISLFIMISWFGLTVFNLFNAGMFLGFLWVWAAVSQVRSES